MKPSLQVKLGQQLKLSPQLRQAIQLLQLPGLELRQKIEAVIESNPILEIDDETAETEISTLEMREGDRPTALFSNQMDFKAPVTLKDHLLWQMELTPFDEQEKLIAAIIIDAINEDGYLECSLEEIQKSIKDLSNDLLKIKLADIEVVLHRIQQFDPSGVGARNLEDCLNIQLNQIAAQSPLLKQMKQLVNYYLECLGKGRFTKLQNKLQLSPEDFKTVLKVISSLNPRPGRQPEFHKTEYRIPDVIVRKKNDEYVVQLYMDYIPKLKMNTHYSMLFKRAGSSQERQFVVQHLKEADWFIKCLEKRHEMLLKVATCIVKQQFLFFEQGRPFLQPLNLQTLSDSVGLHPSNISRLLSNKYMDTPRGLFELKFFLGNSAKSIQATIQQLIAKETTTDPLSDQHIVDILLEQGIKITRRTVAKYRDLLSIPSSYERKQFKSVM